MRRVVLVIGILLMMILLPFHMSVQASEEIRIEGLEQFDGKEFPIKTDLSKIDFTEGLSVYDVDGNTFHPSKLLVDYSKVNVKKHGYYKIDYYFLDLNQNKQVIDSITIKMVDSKAPVIYNQDIFLAMNQKNVNLLNYISVSDDSGLVTKEQVKILTNLDITKVGVYHVNYYVSDSGGNYASSHAKVIVSDYTNLDQVSPVFSHIKEEIVITLGLEEQKALILYKEGVQAVDGNQDITSQIEVDTTNIDRYTVGSYPLLYYVTDGAGNLTVERTTVKVVDVDEVPPVISGPNEIEVTINTLPNYKELINAYDAISGDLSDRIEFQNNVDPNQLGEYSITYTVTDYSGNVTVKTFKVIVKDNVAPNITVPDTVQVKINSTLNLSEHITVTDNYDKDVHYTIDGSKVNLTVVGTYVVTVDATDDSGNTTQKMFFVNVYENNKALELYENPIILGSGIAVIVSFFVLLISGAFRKRRGKRYYR